MRRLLVTCLLLCVLIGLCAPAAALSYTDTADIRNLDAVTMMANLGLVNGYEDGRFRPKNNIRRSEAAKLVALICEAEPKTARAVAFADVPSGSWEAGYVAYCAEKGIIAGANGKFRPNDYVTGREFAKMLLACMGYGKGRYTGSGWAAAVDTDAKNLGVYNGFPDDPGRYISRDEACLLMYNAMQCYAVTGLDANGKEIYALDQLMNPITYMEHRFHVVKFSGVLEANEFADLNTDGGCLEAGRSKLVGHAALQASTPYEFLGRTVEFYTIRTQVGNTAYYTGIGIPKATAADDVFTVTSIDDYNMLLTYSRGMVNESTAYYYNGDRDDMNFIAKLGKDYTITCVDRGKDGVLDLVLATDYILGTVLSVQPLRVSAGGRELPAKTMDSAAVYAAGDTVRCALIGGRYCITHEK